MELLLGKPIADRLFRELKNEVHSLLEQNVHVRLSVVLVGDDPASLAYVAAKREQAGKLSIEFDFHHFPATFTQDELCRKIVDLNRAQDATGVIIQLPLPPQYHKQQVLDCVLPSMDVDALTSTNQSRLSSDEPLFLPPAPAAILEMLKTYDISLQGKHVLLVGAGDLVGKPLARLLVTAGVTVSIITEATKDSEMLLRSADIIITAVGKPGIITGQQIKKDAVIIDAGTSFSYVNGHVKLAGDVDFESVSKIASRITPVPGGIGPVTVAMLYRNVVEAAKRRMS